MSLIAGAWTTLTGPMPTGTPLAVEDDQVTPGVIGFLVTAAFVVAAILLILDMVRRMRNVRYREEARQRIAAELSADAEPDAEPDGPDQASTRGA